MPAGPRMACSHAALPAATADGQKQLWIVGTQFVPTTQLVPWRVVMKDNSPREPPAPASASALPSVSTSAGPEATTEFEVHADEQRSGR